MKEAAYVLFGAAFTTAVSYAAGKLLISRLRLELMRQEERALAFLLGSAVLSWIVFALAAAHIVYKGTFLAVGLLMLGAGWRRSRARPFPALPHWWIWCAAPVFTLFSLLYVCHAMAPEMSPDGSAYHLGLVGRYYREHGFPAITNSIYASLSQGTEMLFLFAYAWGKHSSTALTHLVFLYALASLVLSYGRRFGFPMASTAAAGLVFLSPVAGLDAASAYNDVAAAAVVFGCYYLVQVWDAERHNNLLIVIGVLGGFAFAIKYTAFVALAYALVFVVWRRRPRALSRIALVAMIWIAPWLIKNAIVVGNPVSPFANRIFPNPHVRVAFEEDYRVQMRNYDQLKSHWDIPLEVTVLGQALCGLFGPVFLLAPLALLAGRKKDGRKLLVATAVFGAVYASNVGTRFLMMALPPLALAMCIPLMRVPLTLAGLLAAHAVLSWPDVMKLYCDEYAWRLDRVQWKAALRKESQDGFLARKWPIYSVAKMVDKVTPPDAVVFTFGQIAEAYTTRKVVVSFQSAEGMTLRGIIWAPMFPDMQPTRHWHFSFAERRARRVRIRQTAAGKPDHFSVHELRFFHQGQELARASQWRLRAWPNPWDVRDAFDASPATRWSSWEQVRPGMFIDVDFGREELLDRVVVESAPESGQARLQVDLAPEVEPQEVEAPPPLGLRREAVEVLRSRGITHLLVNDGDYGASDYSERRADWGLTLVGEHPGVKLYALR